MPQDYYAPYKTIHYKNSSSFGYALFNLSPSFFSSLKMYTNNDYPEKYRKYKEETLSGFLTNKYFEVYQYWNTKEKRGLEFSITRDVKYSSFSFSEDYLLNTTPSFVYNNYFNLYKTSFGLQFGLVIKEPVTLGMTLSYVNFQPESTNLNNDLAFKFNNVPGFYFKVGTAFVNGKDKRRFGFFETFGFQYKGEGERLKPYLESPSYLKAYGGLRFFSTSKPIRKIGLIFTFADISVSFENVKFETKGISHNFLDFPFRFGMGLAW
ncbi:MAG TPA: hypothetical protein DEH02_08990 [Bacteroidales bacterium]|nr:MAG: hypothetical protein A2X01_01155 [Bacteroidetes bacterium GWF2_35_48]OFY99896.1 MAG: hypothetical protein A2491_01295 [Bacteroidetes bacterium RIFOXYC12_FULL_35_7]HBX51185.1 hypothetical protein [Bacteroidales bacterium]